MRILLFISLLSASFVWSQAVELSIEPRSVDVGETVIIKVQTTEQGDVDIDNLPSSFIPGQDMMDGMNTEIDYNTGKIITYYHLSRTGVFTKAGKYTIGPAFIKQGNKTFKSNTVVVTVGEKTEMTPGEITQQQLRDPAFGVIQVSKTSIYEGEPILVSAKVYSRFSPTYLDRYMAYSMKGAIDKHPIGNNNVTKTSLEQYRGSNFFTFEYDKNIIFPSGVGDFKIKPFSLSLYDDYRPFGLTSTSAIVKIKALPANAPQDFIGAVGQYTISRNVDVARLKQGDVFKLTITVSGKGNLQNILEPKPKLPSGFIIYGDAMIEEDFSYTPQGAEGRISYEYNIQVSQSGTVELPATSISYFDPEDELYKTVSTSPTSIVIDKNKNFVVQDLEQESQSSLEKVSIVSELRTSPEYTDHSTLYNSGIFWSGVSVPAIALIIFLFGFKNKKRVEDRISQRQWKRSMELEISELISSAKLLAASGDYIEAYSKIEKAALNAGRIKLGASEASRNELIELTDSCEDQKFKSTFKAVINACDQSRFGLIADEEMFTVSINSLAEIVELAR